MLEVVMAVIPILISAAALAVSAVSALRLYDRSQRSNAKDVFVYPVFSKQNPDSKSKSEVCVDNRAVNYPVYNIEVYFLGFSCDPETTPVSWGSLQQLLPQNSSNLDWPVSNNDQKPTTDNYEKRLADCLAGEYINYRIACVYNTSSKRRWLKTYDGKFYRYNSIIAKFRKLPRTLKMIESKNQK